MGLLKIYKKGLVKASSTLESIIAISIITFCILIALRIYVMVIDSNRLDNKLEVHIALNQLISDTRINKNFEIGNYEFDSFVIRKSVSNYANNEKLKMITLLVQDSRDTIPFNYLVINNINND